LVQKTKKKFPTNICLEDNDNKESIDALVKFCKYVPCKVNLIEYNPIDDGEFQQSEDATNAYIKALESNGIVVKVRRSRGKDIDAMWAISK
jgi:23S rRNA (adenine2503-C2)-methyltransferase